MSDSEEKLCPICLEVMGQLGDENDYACNNDDCPLHGMYSGTEVDAMAIMVGELAAWAVKKTPPTCPLCEKKMTPSSVVNHWHCDNGGCSLYGNYDTKAVNGIRRQIEAKIKKAAKAGRE